MCGMQLEILVTHVPCHCASCTLLFAPLAKYIVMYLLCILLLLNLTGEDNGMETTKGKRGDGSERLNIIEQ